MIYLDLIIWLSPSPTDQALAPPQVARDAQEKAEKLRFKVVDLTARLSSNSSGGGVVASPEDGRHTPLAPSAERDLLQPDLAAFLRKV